MLPDMRDFCTQTSLQERRDRRAHTRSIRTRKLEGDVAGGVTALAM